MNADNTIVPYTAARPNTDYWQWRRLNHGDSEITYSLHNYNNLPEFNRFADQYTREGHFDDVDRAFSGTWIRNSLDNAILMPSAEPTRTQLRRGAYFESTRRPQGPAHPEARMLAAINREHMRLDPERMYDVQSIMRRCEINPLMVEKQLEDWGFLPAPDYRTRLFRSGDRMRITQAILELRYGMTSSSAAGWVSSHRDRALNRARTQWNAAQQHGPQQMSDTQGLSGLVAAGTGAVTAKVGLAAGLSTLLGATATTGGLFGVAWGGMVVANWLASAPENVESLEEDPTPLRFHMMAAANDSDRRLVELALEQRIYEIDIFTTRPMTILGTAKKDGV